MLAALSLGRSVAGSGSPGRPVPAFANSQIAGGCIRSLLGACFVGVNVKAVENALEHFRQTIAALEKYVPDWDTAAMRAVIADAQDEIRASRLEPVGDDLLDEVTEDSLGDVEVDDGLLDHPTDETLQVELL